MGNSLGLSVAVLRNLRMRSLRGALKSPREDILAYCLLPMDLNYRVKVFALLFLGELDSWRLGVLILTNINKCCKRLTTY